MRGFLNKDSVSSFEVKITSDPFRHEAIITVYYNEAKNKWFENIDDPERFLRVRPKKEYDGHSTIGDIVNVLEEEFGIGNVDLVLDSIISRTR